MRSFSTAFRKFFFVSLGFFCVNSAFFYFIFCTQKNRDQFSDKIILLQESLNELAKQNHKNNFTILKGLKTFTNYIIYSKELNVIEKSANNMKIPTVELKKFIQLNKTYQYQFNKNKDQLTVYFASKTLGFYAVFKLSSNQNAFGILNLILLLLLCVFLNILFFVFVFKKFIKPLKAVKYNLFELQSENYNVRLNLRENQEFYEISKSFNQIAKSFEKTIHYLEEKNDINSMELEIAKEIQQIIYPDPIENEQFSTYIYHNSVAEISGDYHDIFELPDKSYGFLIVDVSGHGVPAALLTMMVKEKFRHYAPIFKSPSELFTKVNQDISVLLDDFPFFFTAFYLKIDPDNKVFYTNAGNPHAILFSKNRLDILEVESLAMGVDEVYSYMYQTHQTNLEAKDKILLYSDAVLELINKKGEAFGVKRLCECLKQYADKTGDEVMSLLKKELLSFCGGSLENLSDDLTLFLIEIKK